MNKTLFFRECKANYKIILIFMAVLTMYTTIIVAMFDPKIGNTFADMAKTMPELFSAFGMDDVGKTLVEFIANYLYGFILIAFPSVFVVLLSHRLITRYVDKGSMAYLLATPNKRRTVAFTQALFLVVSVIALVVYVFIVQLLATAMLFPDEVVISELLILNIGLCGMLLLLAGICFASACIFNDKYALGIGSGVIIGSLLLQMISQVGDKFEYLKFMTPLTLFDPKGILRNDTNAIISILVLYIISILFFGIGITIFNKKDLSL